MAKDDMEVIMYKILKYLYECMKKDIDPQLFMEFQVVSHSTELLVQNNRYFSKKRLYYRLQNYR